MKTIYEQSEQIIKDLFNQGYTSWAQETTRNYPCDAPIIGVKKGQSVLSWELKKDKSKVKIFYIYNRIMDNILKYDAIK